METVIIYTIGWLGLAAIAIINGVLREKGYGKLMSELTAHQLSTVIAIVLFGVYVLILTRLWKIDSTGQAFVIGGIWLFLTIGFECVLGRYVIGHPWRRIFHDYNLLKGRLWALLLVWTTVAPYIFYRIRF